ncbi:hypothetical protein G7Y89_g15625 [Cudoniella acicularis]|uniref:Uncharacterized protein n=1 Tax=Cudoniella acicularis TaxID=354080 RepID=A0A8H4QI76_9HELO|nr:hypothetical protein G7Y89_g15625 [Cudoniella acicularis]
MSSYNLTHRVVVCYVCDVLSTTVQLLSSYDLRSIRELKEHKPRPEDQCQPIEHLASYDGFYCPQQDYAYYTRHLPKMKKHMASAYKIKAKKHEISLPWKGYDKEKGGVSEQARDSALLTQPEKELFKKLEKDYKDMKCDIEEQATIVQDIRDLRSERVPWLHDLTGFLYHITTLKDEEIWSSYKLPPKKELDAGSEDAKDPYLVRILVTAEAVLRDVYRLCSDTSPDRKMTQQRANILNEFYAGASGKADRFRYFKNASTLVTYFTTMKQLLVYHYRVVYYEGGHFTRAKLDQVLPRDVI